MGIMMLRKDFVVLSWNKCLEEWTGIHKDQIINQDIRERFPHFAEPMYSSRLTTIFEGGPPAIFSSQLHQYIIPSKLPNGKMRIQHTVVTAVTSDSDPENGALALFAIQDVTDFSIRMQDYFLVSKELKQSNQELESFTYSVSHDLKAPLRSINGFSNILEEKLKTRLDPEEKRLMKLIRNSVFEMNQLIEDLLTLSSIGRKTLNIKKINMHELADHMMTRQLKSQKRQSSKCNFSIDDLPPCIADSGLIKQVYANLISNAIKFTVEQSNPVIRLGYKKIDGEIVYTVIDNGIGFDMRYSEKIFGVFQRLTRDEKYPGTGVGLAIVKRIIEKHNGKVWVNSEVDKGTTFYFTLGSVEP